jgi:hypothetical protein
MAENTKNYIFPLLIVAVLIFIAIIAIRCIVAMLSLGVMLTD